MTIGIWDFSAGSIVTLVGCICGYYFNQYGFVAMLASAIISGILLGLINASVYTILRIPSVVVTVGLMLIYESFATVYKGGKGFSITKKASVFGTAPWIFIVAAVLSIIMYYIYNRTKFGFNVKAIGNGEFIAKSAGVNPRKIKFISFFIAGIYLGLAGLVNLSYGTAVAPVKNMSTLSITFDALMSVFIAIYLSRVCNLVIGIVIGNFCMKMVSAGLVAIGVEGTWQQVFIGLFLLFFIGFSTIKATFDNWWKKFSERKSGSAN